jgi:methylenetetrahydrofolate dehydrogenase (NADP+) / methenyltetrahydrofolate cyclohydrolase
MTARIIDGKSYAAAVRAAVRERIGALQARTGMAPGLAVVLVGQDPASEVYVRTKGKQALEACMRSFPHCLPFDTRADDLLRLIHGLNEDPRVHGILVQLPLPAHLDARAVMNAISPAKDVDGFHISNVGKVGTGQTAIVPCAPLGCMLLLRRFHADFRGKTALVIGHSNIVGKPMARLLLNADCTVMVAHKSSTNIPELARLADIVVVAAGVPRLVRAEWIKPGATVIDVGINRIERDGRPALVGDGDFDNVRNVAGAITPVPGGVGPMTIACLLANTLSAFCHQNGLEDQPLLLDEQDRT